MTRVARLSFLGFVLAGALFVVGYGFLPTRVTFGAGSIRCGTAFRPDTQAEISEVCPEIGRARLDDTFIATAIFAFVAAAPIPFQQWIDRRPAARSVVTVFMVGFWLVGGALTAFGLTGAYSDPGA